ncbi:CYTH domain-containing protein [Mucilaginibacter rubeus]|uniref:CYTH domain-containing protein n=1 Tax=Mucilaginibacter rubeus TaxID=2027860 RepID=A0AAE6JDR9_9SPHI|nr:MULTISPECIES: CYTH domain-containing protein [Mucilaginibacter]QEM02957.1 CYTH domain-containing protein [Mucilaginibacter rubeus]QEM15574.1 CYTH domain-containing protein [Mucilaginibacter gossypii]QTE41693.1 CYTH domain-containing protein [Mucilaginibacter rubeus]QTE48297.1 CYTH domain-containing protein [Mucilaginibacter rubeus]QTE59685.1 CYTH domain-containing protein [Mucilaginibacter rubeus]
MAIEIERKFLVDQEKWQQVTKPEAMHFRQGYIFSDEKKTIRVRVTDTEAYITIKGSTAGFSRSEFEYTIPAADGVQLLDNFAASELEKYRYRITYAGKLWEVDEFLGDNQGLLMAEIELGSEDEEFELPPWVTTEVTGDDRYYNARLSVHPFKNW